MSEPAKKEATHEDLLNVPENMTGEIIDGELFVFPRPSRKHIYTGSVLGNKIGPPYQFGEGGGPGGWIILDEPEIGFGKDILVPDLAGWKKERLPEDEPHNWISVAPDWVCEILSPHTARTDKTEKMPIYSEHNVAYLWLIDPIAKTLDVFRLEAKKWVVSGLYVEGDKIRAEPFQEIELEVSDLFWPIA